jgi:hypothetical protein
MTVGVWIKLGAEGLPTACWFCSALTTLCCWRGERGYWVCEGCRATIEAEAEEDS